MSYQGNGLRPGLGGSGSGAGVVQLKSGGVAEGIS